MTLGIVKERKNPPDRRVVFSPAELVKLKNDFPQLNILVESSDVRVFTDDDYLEKGFEIVSDLSTCDVIVGVKEIPTDALIPNKKYFFFSHTIKKQPYNKKLLQAILEKNISLYDHETLVDKQLTRLVGFGRYAGIVGVYNTFRAFGQTYELFDLAKAETLGTQTDLINRLKRLILPPIKVVLTGKGKVGMGAKEMLDGMKMKEVSSQDFLTKTYDQAVYTQIDVLDYNKRKDGQLLDKKDFFQNPSDYVSDFEKYTKVSDIFIAGHFYGNQSPFILTQEMLANTQNKIKIVGDVSCDVGGPVACTLRASTIANPFYGYHPKTGEEVSFLHPEAIVVMAVDNLPCELPRDASEGFGITFREKIIPAFFNNDKEGVLERACITSNGKLTARFSYLSDYVKDEFQV
jgi:alanine dehydrogenase